MVTARGGTRQEEGKWREKQVLTEQERAKGRVWRIRGRARLS